MVVQRRLITTLGREMFEGVDELQVGMQFHASARMAACRSLLYVISMVLALTGDGNHPLAGQQQLRSQSCKYSRQAKKWRMVMCMVKRLSALIWPSCRK